MPILGQTAVGLLNESGVRIHPVEDETVVLLRRIAKLLEASATADSKQRQRIVIDAVQSSTSGGLTEVSAAVPVIATLQTGTAYAGAMRVGYGPNGAALADLVDSRYPIMDAARNAYANSIRTRLSFS